MAQPARQAKVAARRPAGGVRRGRPTLDRIAAIDTAIREAALGVFLELGYESASMDAVALHAGISKGTLYARYESKELLFRAILEDELKRWSQRAGKQDHLLPKALEPRLRHHARTLIEFFGWPEYQRIARLLAAATPTLPNLARHWEEIGTKRYLQFLANDMAKAAGGNEIDWDFHAKLFLFSISGWARADGIAPSMSDHEDIVFADGVVDVILRAIERN